MGPILEATGGDIYENWYLCWGHIPLYFFLVLLCLKELVEFCTHGPRLYLTSFENYLQWIVAIMTIAFIVCAPNDIELGSHLGAWAVFFSWLNTTQLLGRFEFFGVGIFMALHVAKKIIKTFLIFSPTFFAFVFGFNYLYQANPVFDGFTSTTVYLFVMLVGEFNFDKYFSYQSVHKFGGRNTSLQVQHIDKHRNIFSY